MVTNYYTLQALVQEWRADLVGCVLGDAFSQERGELTLALADPEHEWMLRFSVQAPLYYVFRAEGYSKARRNVATLFEAAFGRRVEALRLADRDRLLFIDLEGGLSFQGMLFGPRANVFLVDADGRIVEAFQRDAAWVGQATPLPRPAPQVATFEAFEARWRADRKTTAQALTAALSLFDRTLAEEVMYRAGIQAQPPAACTPDERKALFEAARGLLAELAAPAPHLYWRGRFVEAFALVPLGHLQDMQDEPFETVDAAVRVFIRRTLGQQRFREAFEPLERALVKARDEEQRRAERMLEELTRESRADRYEHWGHLLMASIAAVPLGADAVTLPDLFATGEDVAVTIPLDPSLSAVENAQRYYDKARRTRQAREHAEARLSQAAQRADEAGRLLTRLQLLDTLTDLKAFIKEEEEALLPFGGGEPRGQERVPFRRYTLPGGYEVWVGRNARQNEELTSRHARKHDLWMHARGVPGSHAVLRLPHRTAEPGASVLEQAAAIAAYYSKARGSSLVPVIVVPRKYVRKPKGASPGTVVVEREEVLLVEPRLPNEV